MKIKILVVTSLLIGGFAWGQNEIKIDFKNRDETKIILPKRIKRGDFYKVRVSNINLNRYSVQIRNKDTTISKALELPTFEDFSLDNLTALTNSFGISPFFVPTEIDSMTSLENIDAKKNQMI